MKELVNIAYKENYGNIAVNTIGSELLKRNHIDILQDMDRWVNDDNIFGEC